MSKVIHEAIALQGGRQVKQSQTIPLLGHKVHLWDLGQGAVVVLEKGKRFVRTWKVANFQKTLARFRKKAALQQLTPQTK